MPCRSSRPDCQRAACPRAAFLFRSPPGARVPLSTQGVVFPRSVVRAAAGVAVRSARRCIATVACSRWQTRPRFSVDVPGARRRVFWVTFSWLSSRVRWFAAPFYSAFPSRVPLLAASLNSSSLAALWAVTIAEIIIFTLCGAIMYHYIGASPAAALARYS